ncbi:DGF-1-like protein, putative [Bodo saltans]|uniref:DGF-1-like protein, putative n=1 Tax=Bodo saltans TaxID=75058 RepID=A0A0S4JK48_BODSA|nr:DGF-1-like protein, putative [Bodo saltans]|eukprot:CUG90547.1 DGF-1-like protein, putative [Bodo saltans]
MHQQQISMIGTVSTILLLLLLTSTSAVKAAALGIAPAPMMYESIGGMYTATTSRISRNVINIDGTSFIGASVSVPAQLFIDVSITDPAYSVLVTINNVILNNAAIYINGFASSTLANATLRDAPRGRNITVVFQNVSGVDGMIGFLNVFPASTSIIIRDSAFKSTAATMGFTFKSASVSRRCAVFWSAVTLLNSTVQLIRSTTDGGDPNFVLSMLDASFVLTDSVFMIRDFASRSFRALSSNAASSQYALMYTSSVGTTAQIVRSLLILKDIAAPQAFYLTSPIVTSDKSVVVMEDVKYAENVIQLEGTITIDATSWWYMHRLQYLNYVIQGSSTITGGQYMTMFDLYGSAALSYGSGTAYTSTSYGCIIPISYLAEVVTAFGFSTNRYVACSSCSIATHCYALYTTSVAYNSTLGRCECSCTSQGKGPLCLPMVYPGLNERPSDIPPRVIENLTITNTPSTSYALSIAGYPMVTFRNITFSGTNVYLFPSEAYTSPIGGAPVPANITFDGCTFQERSVLNIIGSSQYMYFFGSSMVNVTVVNCMFNYSVVALQGSFRANSYFLVAHSQFFTSRTSDNSVPVMTPMYFPTTYLTMGSSTGFVYLLSLYLYINSRLVFLNVSAETSIAAYFIGATPSPLQLSTASSIHIAYCRLNVIAVYYSPYNLATVLIDRSGIFITHNVISANYVLYLAYGGLQGGVYCMLSISHNHGVLGGNIVVMNTYATPQSTLNSNVFFLVANNTLQVSLALSLPKQNDYFYFYASYLVVMDNYLSTGSCMFDTSFMSIQAGTWPYNRCNRNDPSTSTTICVSGTVNSYSCSDARVVATSYCHPGLTSSFTTAGGCVCASGYSVDNLCHPVPLFPFYRTPAMIADPINVLSNTTYVLENAVVTTASQYTRGYNILTLGVGYSKVILRNVTFNVVVHIRAATFVQRSVVDGFNTISAYNCTFNMDLRLFFGQSVNYFVLWYLPVSVTINRCTFRQIFYVGNAPPRQSNISLLSSEVFMTTSQSSFFYWEYATLYNSRLQIEHVTCNMNNSGYLDTCVYFYAMNANEKSLILLHDVSAVSTVPTSGTAQPGLVVRCYSTSYIQSSSAFYLSHLSTASVYGVFTQEAGHLIASGSSAIVFENFVVSTKTSGTYAYPPIFVNGYTLSTQSQSFLLVKRINSYQESYGIVSATTIEVSSAYVSVVECEVMGGGAVLWWSNSPSLSGHTVKGKCNPVEGTVTSYSVFSQTLPCSECLSDAECFMPLTTSTAGCVCTCAAGGFGPRCLPVDTSLITTLGGDADLHPVDVVVENTTIGSTIYHLATRSVTWRNVVVLPNAEVFFALDKMFLGMGEWAGQPLVITLENCTLPPGAAIYFWGSVLLTMSNRPQVASGMNLTISGLP